MKIGLLLWQILAVTVNCFRRVVCVLAAELVFERMAKFSGGLWLRFSVVLLGAATLGFFEGALLSPFGFGWYLVAVGLTLYVVAKVARKLLQ
jgi:predicted membrane protein